MSAAKSQRRNQNVVPERRRKDFDLSERLRRRENRRDRSRSRERRAFNPSEPVRKRSRGRFSPPEKFKKRFSKSRSRSFRSRSRSRDLKRRNPLKAASPFYERTLEVTYSPPRSVERSFERPREYRREREVEIRHYEPPELEEGSFQGSNFYVNDHNPIESGSWEARQEFPMEIHIPSKAVYQQSTSANNQNLFILDTQGIKEESVQANPVVIPEFNPDTSKLSARQWLKLIDEIGTKNGWKNDEKRYHMCSKLAGFAKQWYLGQCKLNVSWHELKTRLIQTFPTEMDYFNQLKYMLSRMKKPDESLATYFNHKVALLDSCEITGRRAVSCIIGGIENHNFRHEAKEQNFPDADSLYTFLNSKEAVNEDVKLGEKKEKSKKKLLDKPAKGSLRCYNCNGWGHYASVCEEKKNDRKPNGVLSMNPRFYADVRINGFVLRGYIDNSSECVTIREENARKLSLPFKRTHKIIRGFGGSTVSTHGEVEVTMCVDRAIATLVIDVVPDHVQPVPVIVGGAFTNLSDIHILKDDDGIRIFQRTNTGSGNFDFHSLQDTMVG